MALAALLMVATWPAPAAAPPRISEDERALRRQASDYVQAFSSGDTRKIADMWTNDATFTQADGQQFHGRSAIEKVYSDFFTRHGGQPMQVTIESIKFPSPNVAVEEGVARLLSTSTGSATHYLAVHARENGKWRMSRVTESQFAPAANAEPLKDLSWMVGRWVAQGAKEKMQMQADWIGDKNFIYCSYRPLGTTGGAISDAEIIGYDPGSRKLTSWHFDADGGSGVGYWTKDGDNWLVRAQTAQLNGRNGRATYIVHKGDNDTFTWRSVRRSLDGARLPDSDEIKVSREK